MKLIKLTASNVFSLGSVIQPLDNLGLTMVTGWSHDEQSANGAGKSSLSRNALLWGLFGQVMGDAKGDDVINRHSKTKKSYVQTDFTGIDNKNYTIIRSRNPNILKLHGYEEKPRTVGGKIFSKDLSFRLERQTQELINSLLGRDFKSFIQTDFFGQGRKLSYFELQPAEQKDIIDQILPLEYLNEWEKYAKDIRNILREEIQSKKLSQISLEGKAKAHQENLPSLKEKLDKWTGIIQMQVTNQEKFIIQLDKQMLEIEKHRIDAHKEINELINKYKLGDIKIVAEKVRLLEDQVLEENKKMAVLQASYDKAYEKVEFHNTILTTYTQTLDTCPTCLQKVDVRWKEDEIKKTLDENERLISVREHTRGLLVHEADIDNRLEKTRNDEKVRLNTLEKHMENVDGLQKQILNFTAEIRDCEKIIEKEKIKLTGIREEKNPYNELITDTEAHIREVNQAVKELEDKQTNLKDELERIEVWVRAFSKDLKTLLFEQACPFLEEKTNHYLDLLNNSQIRVRFSTLRSLKSGDLREEFNVQVESKTGGNIFSLMSGGEQQITNFAVGLALSDFAETQVTGSSKFMILDEPFVNLDARNCENIISFLTEHLSKKKDTILFISNEEGLKNLIPNRIHIEKKNGISEVVK